MRNLALIFILLITTQAFAQEKPISGCDRHPKVREALEQLMGLPCQKILRSDLSRLFLLEVEVNISELTESDFRGLHELGHLILKNSDHSVSQFPTGLFKNTPRLKQLRIVGGNFSSLPKDEFSKLINLTALEFDDCHLGTLTPDFFAPFSLLVTLQVPADSLLNQPYPELTNIWHLSISGGNMGHLGMTFFNSLPNLISLNLRDVSFENAKQDIFSSSIMVSLFSVFDVDLGPFANGRVDWPKKISTLVISFSEKPAILPVGLFDHSPLEVGLVSLEFNFTLQVIPDNLFVNLAGAPSVNVNRAPLKQTNKAAFNGVQVFGLPENFGVTDTGGTSEEWAP